MLGYGECTIGNEPGCVKLQLEKNDEPTRCSGIAGGIKIVVLLSIKIQENKKLALTNGAFFLFEYGFHTASSKEPFV